MKRTPRLSPLQIFTHMVAWIPLGVLAYDYFAGNLGVNPIQAATQRAGNTALIFLVLSLACTPLNTLFRLPVLNKLSRPLGLYAYMYAATHLLIFTGLDYGFDLELLLLDLADKRYILVGLTGFILLTVLAITSFRWWMVRLGKKWKKLHRVVYLVNLLIVLHFGWAIKGDFFRLQGDVHRPLLAGLVVITLLALRLPAVRKRVAGQGVTFKRQVEALLSRAKTALEPRREPLSKEIRPNE